MDLTPNKLLDNLNKHFYQIVGEALVGYYQYWKAEQAIKEHLTSVGDNMRHDVSFLLALANCIQYGKSYFADEVIKNLTEMENIINYTQLVLPYIHNDNENVNENNDEKDGQKGGLPGLFKSILGLIAGLTINSCNNSTAFAISVASPNQEVAVYSEAGGIFPRAKPVFTQSIDVNNQTQMEEFSKQFRADLFPQDSNYSVNISEQFKETFVENMATDFITKFLTNEEQLSREFSLAMETKVKDVNKVMFEVHKSLETMCRSFVETRDPLLPIRLFQVFNDEYERNVRRVGELETELVEQKQKELKSQKLLEMGVTQEEPGIIERTANNLPDIGNIGKLFSFGSSTQAQLAPSNTLSVSELTQIYDRVKEDISQEIEELGPVFKKQATQQALGEAMSKFTKGVQASTDVSNLQAYFSAVCTIKKSYYVYDKKTGLLTIVNPARSRFHLTILARNVIDYYEKIVTEGVKSVDERSGEVITDIPDTTRKTNLQSLYEKAHVMLTDVLSAYDRNLVVHLGEGTSLAGGNVEEFFQYLVNTWVSMKEPIKQATQNFPLTSRQEELERNKAREEFEREMKQKGFENAQAIQQRMMELEQKSRENKLTEEELEIWSKYVQLKVLGVLDPVKVMANSLLSTTADIVVTGAEGVGKVVDSGIGTITRNVYGIAWAGMAVIIPLMLGACILGCGPCGALFAFIIPKKRRRGAPRGPRRQPANVQGVAPAPADLAPSPSPSPNPSLSVGFAAYRSEQPSFGSLSNRPTFGSPFTGILPTSRSFGSFRERKDDLSDEDDDYQGANTSLTGTEDNPVLLPPSLARNVSDREFRAVTRNVQGFGLSGGLIRRRVKKTRKHKKRKTRKGARTGKRKYTRNKRR